MEPEVADIFAGRVVESEKIEAVGIGAADLYLGVEGEVLRPLAPHLQVESREVALDDFDDSPADLEIDCTETE